MASTFDPPPAAPLTAAAARQLATALGAYLVVNASTQLLGPTLPDVQGGLGASADEASWVATAFTMGLFAGVVVSSPLMRALGLGRYLVVSCGGFALLASASAMATSWPVLTALRAGQGVMAGGLGPIAFVAIFTLTGRPRLMGGLAVLAFVLLIPASIGGALAGAAEEALGWRGLFWLQALLGLLGAAAALAFVPRVPIDLRALRTDWVAIGLLTAALCSLTLVLSQGTRRFWIESDLILVSLSVAIGTLTGFTLMAQRRPGAVINGALLMSRRFAFPISLNLLFRTGSAASAFVAPQFVVTAHALRPIDLSPLYLAIFAGQVMALPLVWWLLHRVDARAVIAAGLVLSGFAATFLATATVAAGVDTFQAALAVTGFAQVLFLVPNLQAGGAGLTPADGPTASLAFNASSTGGVTLGAGLAAHLVAEREKYHSNVLVEQVSAFEGATAERLESLAALLGVQHAGDGLALDAAVAALAHAARLQATTLAYNDAALLLGLLMTVAALGAVFFVPQPPLVRGQRPANIPGAA